MCRICCGFSWVSTSSQLRLWQQSYATLLTSTFNCTSPYSSCLYSKIPYNSLISLSQHRLKSCRNSHHMQHHWSRRKCNKKLPVGVASQHPYILNKLFPSGSSHFWKIGFCSGSWYGLTNCFSLALSTTEATPPEKSKLNQGHFNTAVQWNWPGFILNYLRVLTTFAQIKKPSFCPLALLTYFSVKPFVLSLQVSLFL